MENFEGYKIRLLRRENGLTIQELAKLVNLSPSAIGMYERGVRRPDLSLAIKLSKLFNLNVNDFYTNEEHNEQNAMENLQELIEDVDIEFINERENVKKEVLNRANGFCELCNNFAPFIGNDGLPYLEIHEIEPQGPGVNSSETTFVALCPNCYKRLQVLRLKGI
ncbi:helix-turn-helix domain-containing protein [Bacillus cereus]